MNATNRWVGLGVGGLLMTLASLAAVGCAGPSAIFEKGKTYTIESTMETADPHSFVITVTDIGPAPWVKAKIADWDGGRWIVRDAEQWINTDRVTRVDTEPVEAPTSQPATAEQQPAATGQEIDTGDGRIPVQGGGCCAAGSAYGPDGTNVPADGLKYLGALCRKYMAKRGESWFMCHMKDGEKQVCEYRGVTANSAAYGLSEAQRLNGDQWLGGCSCAYQAMRCYADGKWAHEWSEGGCLWMTELSKKNGTWQAKIDVALPVSEWSIPQDSK